MSACCKQINKTWRIFPHLFLYVVTLAVILVVCSAFYFLKNESREKSAVVQLVDSCLALGSLDALGHLLLYF